LTLYPDDIPALLPDAVDEEAWEEAAQAARRADWFDPDKPGQLPDQVAARMCWALAALAPNLPDIKLPQDEATLSHFATAAIQSAQQQHIHYADGIAAAILIMSQSADRQLVIPAWMPESSHKDVNPGVTIKPFSNTYATDMSPSVALDSGIHAGMTAMEP